MDAVDGVDGFEKALSFGPDLIISDIMMPLMDGIELVKKLKTDDRQAYCVILLTARSSQKDLLAGLETGADDYLSKPFNSEDCA
jgi:DNA-binding response OmpR family regulator